MSSASRGRPRNRRSSNFKFRRQQPVGPCIVYFVCFEAKLVIERDGIQPDQPENDAHDRRRTAFLEREGFRVRRFRNNELRESFEGVLDAIFNLLRQAD